MIVTIRVSALCIRCACKATTPQYLALVTSSPNSHTNSNTVQVKTADYCHEYFVLLLLHVHKHIFHYFQQDSSLKVHKALYPSKNSWLWIIASETSGKVNATVPERLPALGTGHPKHTARGITEPTVLESILASRAALDTIIACHALSTLQDKKGGRTVTYQEAHRPRSTAASMPPSPKSPDAEICPTLCVCPTSSRHRLLSRNRALPWTPPAPSRTSRSIGR